MARNPWMGLAWQSWMLGMESATVIGLRTARLAAGGSAAQREWQLMMSEKMGAAAALQAKALSGALGATMPGAAAKSVAHYRSKVRANRRRLSRR